MKIEHLSVSHVNEFLNYRSRWFMSRILGYKFPMSVAGHRGTAVETGVAASLRDDNDADPITLALSQFDELCSEIDDSAKIAEERADIPRLIESGIEAMAELIATHGKVVKTQRKLEAKLLTNGYPWIGYTDFEMADETIVDLKTSNRTNSAMPGNWGRQGAFYRFAATTFAEVKFLQLVPLKTKVNANVLTLVNDQRYLGQLRDAERAITALLSLNPIDISPAFLPSPDDFFMDDKAIREAAATVWSF